MLAISVWDHCLIRFAKADQLEVIFTIKKAVLQETIRYL